MQNEELGQPAFSWTGKRYDKLAESVANDSEAFGHDSGFSCRQCGVLVETIKAYIKEKTDESYKWET